MCLCVVLHFYAEILYNLCVLLLSPPLYYKALGTFKDLRWGKEITFIVYFRPHNNRLFGITNMVTDNANTMCSSCREYEVNFSFAVNSKG